VLKRLLIFVHRWLGVALCLLFLLWFPSGIVMMYWDFPSVSPASRLERSPALDPAAIRVSPAEAADKAGLDSPGQVRLNTFDGRPVYRFRASASGEAIVYADTGEEQLEFPRDMVDRIASTWSGQSAASADVRPVQDVDQWTLQTRLQDIQPLWKYTWPDGQQVYVSQATGEVVQYTTTASRWGAYLGAIPHWLYFTPLRKHGPQWSQAVIWSSAVGTVAAILGMAIGVWMYSPSKRYRFAGAPTSIPYRGQKRWHTILGLIFGLGAVTWAFSGMLSMDPFPARPTGGPSGARPGGASAIPQALRGRGTKMADFAAKHPRAAVAQVASLGVKELELTSVAGQPVYLATTRGGTRIIPLDGAPQSEFDRDRLFAVINRAAESAGGADLTLLRQYDRYYLDRHGEKPLPVILVQMRDEDRTRYYVDPRTARIVGGYTASSWMNRWLYHGLHSLDFPWLYRYRPLWDVVVLTFMVGGTSLCVTSLILAWRVLGRKLRGAAAGAALSEQVLQEDLI
jgi:hypothetical protein